MWTRIGLCAGLLFAVGCTKSADHGELSPERLSDGLLTITEMSGNWQETQRQFFSERSNENPSIDPSLWCPEAADVASDLPSLAGASGADVEMQSKDTQGGARMMRLQAWSNADATQYVDRVIEAARLCDGIEWTDEIQVTASNDVIDDRQIGDASVSWLTRIVPPPTTQKDKFESVGRTTVARIGSIVMVLQIGDANWTGTTEPLEEDQWWSIVEAAAKKLDRL